jgi:transposase
MGFAERLQRFRHPEHGYRNCLGLLSLTKRYGAPRVEAACTLALELGQSMRAGGCPASACPARRVVAMRWGVSV